MDQPLVSIVTPSYNYGQYLGACLHSVQRQTYPRIEHILFDACSSDSTPQVLAQYAGWPNLTIIVEKDQGQADALNKGFARARGDVLCWLNADDYFLHERVVAEAVEALAGGGGIVTSGGRSVDECGRERNDILPNHGLPLSHLRYVDTLLQPATFWSRGVHLQLRADLQYAFDWRLFLDMLHAGASFRITEGRWAAYRMHRVNKTAQDPARRKREIAQVLKAEWGPISAQYLWAIAVYGGYLAAERVGSPLLKKAVRLANERMHALTRGRVYSC